MNKKITEMFRLTLLKKFLIAFLLVSLVPLIIAEVQTIRKSENELKSALDEQYYLIINQLRSSLDEIFINKWVDYLSSIVSTIETGAVSGEDIQNSVVNGHLQSMNEFIIAGVKKSGRDPVYYMKNELVTKYHESDGNQVRDLFYIPDQIPEGEKYQIGKPVFLKNSQKFFLPIDLSINPNDSGELIRGVFDFSAILEYISEGIPTSHHEIYIVNDVGEIVYQTNSARFSMGDTLEYLIVEKVKNGLDSDSRFFQTDKFTYKGELYGGGFAISQYIDWGIIVVDRYKFAYALVAKLKSDIILLVIVAVILGILFSVFFAKSFSKQISYLANVSKKIGKGDLDVKIKVLSKDEIGQLSDSLQEMVVNLKGAVEVREKLVVIEEEVKIATRIQQSILPKSFPDMKRLDFCATYLPMEGVAGDFYDYHIIDKDRIGVLVADVSGHGIPAALISAMVKIAFSQQKHIADQPGLVLKEMNATLADKMENQFLTASYLVLDLKNRKLKLADAGHCPFIIWQKSKKEFATLKPPGLIMGWSDDSDFPVEEFTFNKGDRMFLYTDGIVEAHSLEREQFQESRLLEFIERTQRQNVHEVVESMIITLSDWVGEGESFEDDVTLVVIDMK